VTLVVALGCVVVSAYLLRSVWVGDATIYLPYARNAARGDLFAFNPGEFSSGSTSPLWALLLSLPYVVEAGHDGARVFAAGFACVALGLTAWQAARVSGSLLAASLPGFFLVAAMTLYAVSLFESALVVSLAALSVLFGDRVAGAVRGDGPVSARTLAPLGVTWALLPLARPEAVILVAAQLLGLVVAAGPGARRRALALAPVAALAAIPALAYFGYSQLELGAFSTSSDARAFALREEADEIGPFVVSDYALDYVRTLRFLPVLVAAAIGGWLLWREPRWRWLSVYTGLAFAGYAFFLSFVAPGFFDTARYFLPVAPLLVAAAARALRAAEGTRWLWPVAVLALVAFARPVWHFLHTDVPVYRDAGLTFAEVFERDAAERVAARARPGDRLLAYEVQLRYVLDRDVDVLSLDGATDGKVAAYRDPPDLAGFLRRHRPRFWIGDDNVDYRPYLHGSVLARAQKRFEREPALTSAVIDGIGFRVVARRERPLRPLFGGWKVLYELTYPRRP
jgi:hypothetical protein